jgi:hypothetical protein
LLGESRGSPLHLIFITDEPSRSVITTIAIRAIGKRLAEDIIMAPSAFNHKRFPRRLRIEFVRLATIAERHRDEIEHMKKFFCVHYPEGYMVEVDGKLLYPNRKYEQDSQISM